MTDERDEALRLAKEVGVTPDPCPLGITVPFLHFTEKEIAEFYRLARQSAPQRQEPVAWYTLSANGNWMYRRTDPQDNAWKPLYAAPPAAPAAVQEKFHPDASHVPPDYRDGWNAAIDAMTSKPPQAAPDAELVALRRDAERYRWLRDIGDKTWVPLGKRPGINFTHEIDAAIDAALRAKREEGK